MFLRDNLQPFQEIKFEKWKINLRRIENALILLIDFSNFEKLLFNIQYITISLYNISDIIIYLI